MEENNFFGFVSKIGSLIGNNKPKEIKKPKVVEKKYNIKISSEVENEKEMDNIDKPIDINEEEEEEEEDDEENKETEEEKKEREEKEKIEKEEKDKIQNLVLDILNDNDNKKNEENSKLDLNENIINEDNDNNINNINNEDINPNKNKNCPQILNNSFPVINNNINDAFIYDETSSCHLMLKKGNDININDFIIFPILFMEKEKNLFYKIGMTNTPSYEKKKYIFFFDEHYLYFAKDEIIPEEMDDDTRRITKIVSLFDIKDFTNDHINEQFFIKLTIQKELKPEKIISFYIEENFFPGFIKNFNLKLSIFGIDFFTDKNNQI